MHLKSLYERWKAQAQFYFVYVSEAHPGTLRFLANADPETKAEWTRKHVLPADIKERAKVMKQVFKLSMPVCVNLNPDLDQQAELCFPTGIVGISPDGVIRYAQGLERFEGPLFLDVDKLRNGVAEFVRRYAGSHRPSE